MIRLCVFDLDGTLSDTLESIALYGNEALRECGYPAEIPTDRFRYLVGEGVDVLIARMLREAGVPEEQSPEDTARLREAFLRRYTQEPLRIARAYDGVAEMLRVLRDRGIRLAILSNKPHDLVRPVVSHLFADIPFACCYGQREGVPRKPDPQGLLQILEELGIPKEDCLYVGDTGVDMQTGRRAGVRTVGVLWGFRDQKELQETGADAIVCSPKELLPLCGDGAFLQKELNENR